MVLDLKNERLLVIAPHADDEVLGCFGLIHKVKQNGGKVFVQILTLGGYSRVGGGRFKKETWRNEFINTCKFLKVDKYDIMFYDDEIIHFDSFPQAQLIDYIELESSIAISKINPTIIAIPTLFSSHQDHLTTHEVAMISLRHYHHRNTHLQKFIVSYEFLDSSFWSTHSEFGNFSPNFYIPLSKNEIKKKVKSFNFYKSQHRSNHRDINRILTIAKFRGGEMGVEYAEGYRVHRLSLGLGKIK